MSYLYTQETATRDKKQDNLINIIDPLVIWDDSLYYYPYVISQQEDMRMDLVCFNIYGNFNYIDELLTLNNILNPWSIKEGDIIFYTDEDSLSSLRLDAKTDDEDIVTSLVNPNKDNKKDPNRAEGTGLPPTIKPAGIKDVEVDFSNKKIKIIDKFK